MTWRVDLLPGVARVTTTDADDRFWLARPGRDRIARLALSGPGVAASRGRVQGAGRRRPLPLGGEDLVELAGVTTLHVNVEADGRFRVDRLVPGLRYSGRAYRDGAALGAAFAELTFAPGEARDLGDIATRPPVADRRH